MTACQLLSEDRSQGRCEFGMLPLTNDGETIHQILAIEDYEFPAREVDPERI